MKKRVLSCVLVLCVIFSMTVVMANGTVEVNSSNAKIENEESCSVYVESNGNVINEMKVKLLKSRSEDTINFVISGRYYYKKSGDTISNYGMEGSADYTGNVVKNVIYSVYHNVKAEYKDKFSAASSKTKSNISDGVKLKGTCKLKNTDTNEWEPDIAKITITIKKDGYWKTEGNYGDLVIN